MMTKKWRYIGVVSVIGVYVMVMGYRLRMVPGEWYGDISIQHEEVEAILSGSWPWRFALSAGPASFYMLAGYAFIFGATYMSYKIASVIIGFAGIGFVYLLGRELFRERVGWLTAIVGSISFWYMLMPRLGSSPHVLSPVLAVGAVYFIARFARTKEWWTVVASMALAGLGLFNYPATFVLPVMVGMIMVWQFVISPHKRQWRVAGLLALAVMLVCVGIFWRMTRNDPGMSGNGYVGSKMGDSARGIEFVGVTLGKNLVRAMGMFSFTGDSAFRSNASGKPMLDGVSSVLFFVGLGGLCVYRKWRPKWGYILLPIIVLLMPSAAPGIPSGEIPSAGRALGTAPFVFLLVALGIEVMVEGLLRLSKARIILPVVGVSLVLGTIGYLNLTKYFGIYAWGLPEHNQAWGLQIAGYIDTLPSSTVVKLGDCCWGAWGQPEPKGIYYVLKRPEGRQNLINDPAFVSQCSDLQPGVTHAVIMSPVNQALIDLLSGCSPGAEGKMHLDALGQPAFYVLQISL